MIYFFHHYELPAILQQIRIQEMLLQNQQVGTQTTLQDNLNNNTTVASTEPGSRPPLLPAGLAGEGGGPLASGEAHAAAVATAPLGGNVNWVAETAAVITEASFLSNLSATLLDASAVPSTVANGSTQNSVAAPSNAAAQIPVSGDHTEIPAGPVATNAISPAAAASTVETSSTEQVPATSPIPSTHEGAPGALSEGSGGHPKPQVTDCTAAGHSLVTSAFLRPKEGPGEADSCPTLPDNTPSVGLESSRCS